MWYSLSMNTNVTRKGRPPLYVQLDGRIVEGLSGPKSPVSVDGRYYSTHNDPVTGKRIYFGCDLDEAVELFEEWKQEIYGE